MKPRICGLVTVFLRNARGASAAFILVGSFVGSFPAVASAETPVERGSYLATSIGACGNCHGRDAAGTNVYPVSSFTWLLISSRVADAKKKRVIIEFLHWMLAEGQSYAEALSYSRLPRGVVERETQAISRIE